MLDIGTKINDNDTSAGELTAEEFNNHTEELENAVKPFVALSGLETNQLVKSIDKMSKANVYVDTGTANTIELSRSVTADVIETLFDGMTFMFTPAFANTGATTLKVKTLTAKNAFYNGVAMVSGFLQTNSRYIAVYDLTNDRFNIDLLVNYANLALKADLSYVNSRPTGQKNLIINSRQNIQQRGTTGGKKQVILNVANLGGEHTISFLGTATVTIKEAIAIGASDATTSWDTPLATNVASGTTVTLTNGKFIHVEFSTTDFNRVQLEAGSVASNYEYLHNEIDLCLFYYEKGGAHYQHSVSDIGDYRRTVSVSPKRLDGVTTTSSINYVSGTSTLTTERLNNSLVHKYVTTAIGSNKAINFNWAINAEIFYADDGVGINYKEDRWYV